MFSHPTNCCFASPEPNRKKASGAPKLPEAQSTIGSVPPAADRASSLDAEARAEVERHFTPDHLWRIRERRLIAGGNYARAKRLGLARETAMKWWIIWDAACHKAMRMGVRR
jgi:hypothetical protein